MSAWQDQIVANSAAIQQLIDNAKEFNEHITHSSPLANDDIILMQIASTGKTVQIPFSDLVNAIAIYVSGTPSDWITIEGSDVRKGDGNSNLTLLEDGDWVRNKLIDNGGSPTMIVIAQYDETAGGGDKTIENSYIAPWIISS